MSASYTGTVSTYQTGTTGTGTVTVGTAAAAGTLVVVACEAMSGPNLTSVSDSETGNTWTVFNGATNSTSARAPIAWCVLTTGLTTSDTITLHFAASTNWAAQAFAENLGGATGVTLDVSASNQSATALTTLTATTPAVAGAGELLIANLATGNTPGTVTVTGVTNHTSSTTNQVQFGTTDSTGTGAQAVDYSWTSSRVGQVCAVALILTGGGTATSALLGFF